MPKISLKGQQMPSSPIRKLVPFADKAKAEGKKIYHLNIGQPDIKTPTQMMNAIKNVDFDVLAYSHSAGNESYRKKLPEYYAKYNVNINPNQIIITTGGSEAIFFGLFSCLDPGDEIIIPEPLYANYNGFTCAGNIVVKPITATIENNFALPPIEEFEKCISPKTKAILICNPNNPTGYLYSKQELETLRTIVLKHDLFLFADEVYREFVYDGEKAHSILSLEGLEQHAIVVDSISKRYSACGARIGSLITKNEQVLQAAMKFAQARLSPPSFGQIAAEAALTVPDTYFNQVLTEYTSRRNTLVNKLQQISGVTCPLPKGAFYATAKLPIDDSDKFCQWMLEKFDYNGQTVMMAPGTGFYATNGLGKQEVRLAYVLNNNDLENSVKVLQEALKAYNS